MSTVFARVLMDVVGLAGLAGNSKGNSLGQLLEHRLQAVARAVHALGERALVVFQLRDLLAQAEVFVTQQAAQFCRPAYTFLERIQFSVHPGTIG